jgi:NMD protein affecting ribosome stability and mRNA decay
VGMFDTVSVACPRCGEPSDFQSKSGACRLETYKLEDAPDEVLLDVNRHAPNTCLKCGARFHIEITAKRLQALIARPVIWEDKESGDEGVCTEAKAKLLDAGENHYARRHNAWDGISRGERIRSAVSDIRFMLGMRGVRDQLAPVLGPNNVEALDEMLAFIVESTDP